MGFSKLTKLYVINVCFMDDCFGEGWGEGGKEWEEVGSGDVLFWSLPGCVHATLLSTISCNFLNCYLFTYETYLRVLKKSFKWAFYIESEFVGFWRPRGKPECAVKNLSEQGRAKNKSTQIWWEPGRHNWWQGSANLTAAPALLPKFVEVRHMKGDYPVDLAQTAQS